MAVLSGLTKDSVLKAQAEIEFAGGYDKRNEPAKYFLIYEGKRYPPKVAACIRVQRWRSKGEPCITQVGF